MSAAALLDRLDKVRQTGPNRWLGCCPAHPDKTPSLSVRELEDGRVLAHCFSGCEIANILAAVGLEFSDLYPPRMEHYAKPERRPFPAGDVLHALANEVMIVLLVASDMLKFLDLFVTREDYDRLFLAVERIQTAAAMIEGGRRHG